MFFKKEKVETIKVDENKLETESVLEPLTFYVRLLKPESLEGDIPRLEVTNNPTDVKVVIVKPELNELMKWEFERFNPTDLNPIQSGFGIVKIVLQDKKNDNLYYAVIV